ncbi:MFS transporter [Ornithinibacillus halophilus]|uniref:MFS transporter, DHA1 family, purine base/nucleoside efflux pump n=1 Tax=Ornithinibacillus halophilus TaxID=930117 RepID=A0A1M5FWW0_9BACI|nr:MFS transporter [Ornithinibacillus halophilus]SHF95943.1 MFS transporter, DHA1 family, purine base/nucleoside efflux pump [Ornithinibacillus halophilus]
MDKRVYLLMIISFVIGMVELIISGILDLIAEDLNVTLGQAGYLITIFSLIFAIASPILLIATAKIERKRLTLINLIIFLLGNIVTVLSPNYSILFLGRMITATSGALLIILCLVMAPTIVEPKYRGRAIGIVSMGVSGSLVLGIPIGLMLGNAFGWRAPFLFITILTVFSIIGVSLLMERVEPKPSVPIRTQLATLKSSKILFAQITTFLYIAGHTSIYAYLKPFIQSTTSLDGNWISIIYFVFGVAAVSGGGIGGTLSDRFGSNKIILVSIVIFSVTIFAIPYTTVAISLFLLGIVIWGILSWAITPAMQSYLIDASPETSDIQQSLNNSSLHFGIAFGSLLGGLIIEHGSVEQTATIGGVLVTLSLVTALISMKKHHVLQEERAVG